ncbi:MAG: hypothetical protein QNJ16_09130 [Rhodobacter sp.]|nr:hypothetical protein [Rhodobacter sp.]
MTGVVRNAVADMNTLKAGYASLSLLANLNWDRALFLGMIAVALFAASYVVTL